MADYPRDLVEFEARFSNERACRDYLFALRWPDGFRCLRCGHHEAWPVRSILLQCSACGRQSSLTAGAIFQDTRKPMTLWFRAIWWLARQKTGSSALGLQRVLGLGSYQTAWVWLRKLRRAIVRPGRDRLTGRVEVDESYLGRAEKGVCGRPTHRKPLIAMACEEQGKGIGGIRLRHVRDVRAESLMPSIRGRRWSQEVWCIPTAG